MKRLLTLVALALGTVATYASVTGAEAPPQTNQFRPEWQVGDQWVVETQTPQTQTASPQAAIAKARWRFTVEAVEPMAQADCFRIVCRPADAQEPKTVVWVDRKTTAIRQIQTQLPTPAGYKTVTESYQSTTAAPVVGPLTVLPIALPQFSQPGIKSLDAYQYETISGPGGIKAAGDVGFSTDIRQTFSKPSADRIKNLFDEQHIKSLEDRPLVEVHLSTPVETVRQVWAEGAPWPVVADNGLTVARLVQATRAGDRGQEPETSVDEGDLRSGERRGRETGRNRRSGERRGRETGRSSRSPAFRKSRASGSGIKHLETRDGLERGNAQFVPWSGYWWPIRQGRLLVPLGKYDRLTGYKAAVWERKHNPPGPDVPQWFGYCHAWSAASVLEVEPTIERMVRTELAHLGLGVGDQKGLLTACHTEDLANSWGDRYGDAIGGEDRQDLQPDLLWRLLKLHVGQQGVPLVLDVESGEEVWNYPVYQYEIRYKTSGRAACTADLTLLMADDAVPPDYRGTKTRKQTYKFSFKMRDGLVVSGSGQWLGRSKQDHPDFAWYPFKAVASNPEVKYVTVRKLVDGDQQDPDTGDEQPTEPETPPEQPNVEPAEPVTPPAEQPSAKPTRPKPETVRPKAKPKPPVTQPSQNARLIVLSPMELVALIANKTSSFAFDAMLDRFDGASYRPGETFTVRVKSAKPGYLYLLQVDSSGTPALIYPTASENNRIPAGKLVDIRPRGAKTGFPVIGPAGVVRVKAVVTSRPLAFSGSLEGFQGQTPVQSQGQAEERNAGRGGATTSQRQIQVQPVQFRWHPTQRQQVQQLLSQEKIPADAEELGCKPPQEILGPFAQDMTAFYVDVAQDRRQGTN